MNVLIDSGSYGTGNLGDLAMLTGLIDRLQRLRPDSSVTVVSLVPSPDNIDMPPYDVVAPICLARSRINTTAYGYRCIEESIERYAVAV